MKNKSKKVELEFNLPEYKKKDINVKVKKDSLALTANKSNRSEVQKDDFFHKEESSSSFSYFTSLPPVKHKKAKTSFRKGVLKVVVPKKK
jgi:HSP20 family molecular chaperone IbpA